MYCMITLQMLAIRPTPNTLHITALKTSLRGSTIVTTPILQITKLRLREVTCPNHAASMKESQDLNPSSMAPEKRIRW